MSLRKMAASVAAAGRDGDKHLIHITDEELQELLNSGMTTRNPETGLYEASWWTKIRDAVESVGSVVGNYFYPGSGLLTSQLVSKGAQEHLGSGVGQAAMLGSGIAGGVQGNMSNYGATWDAATGGAASGGSLEAPDWYKAGLADGSIAQGTDISSAAAQTGNIVEPGQWSGPVDEFGQAIQSADVGGGVDEFGQLLSSAGAGGAPVDVGGGVDQFGNAIRAAAPAAPAGPAPSGIGGGSPTTAGGGSFADFLKGTLKDNKNLIVPGLAMGASMLAKPNIEGLGDLKDIAGAAGRTANELIPSVSTGQLPAGAQTQVNTAVQDAITSIKSKYAQMGMSGSTMEAQEISSAQARGEAMKFDMANKLTQTGLAAAGVASGDYETIMKTLLQQDSALQTALANFASSSAMGAGLNKAKA